MKSISLILLAIMLSATCFGQGSDKDTLQFDLAKKRLENSGANRYPLLNERKLFDNEVSVGETSRLERINYATVFDSIPIDMNISVPRFYQGPTDNYLGSSLNPFANDYRYYGNFPINDRSWISSVSGHDTFLTIGSMHNIRGMYNYMLTDNLMVSGGGYISKYQLGGNIYDDAGVNMGLKYNITDRISVHAFGQYSGFARQHGLDATDRWNMQQNTNYGGAFEYRITDKFGLMGGMSRELNPMTGKWKNVPFLVPVFYNK